VIVSTNQGDVLPTGKYRPEALALIQQVLEFVEDRPLDKELEFQLNRRFGPYGAFFERLAKLLKVGLL
jgi:hypothetical protein